MQEKIKIVIDYSIILSRFRDFDLKKSITIIFLNNSGNVLENRPLAALYPPPLQSISALSCHRGLYAHAYGSGFSKIIGVQILLHITLFYRFSV